MPSAQPLTAQRVLNFLVKHGLKWYVDSNDQVRTKIKKQCHCLLTAYVYLNHNLCLEECDVVEFATTYLDIDEDQAGLLVSGADQTIEEIADEYDAENQMDMRKAATKIRKTLENWAQAPV